MNFLYSARRLYIPIITIMVLQLINHSSPAPVQSIPTSCSLLASTPTAFTTFLPTSPLIPTPTSPSALESTRVVTTTLIRHYWVAKPPITVTTTVPPTGNTVTITVTAPAETSTPASTIYFIPTSSTTTSMSSADSGLKSSTLLHLTITNLSVGMFLTPTLTPTA